MAAAARLHACFQRPDLRPTSGSRRHDRRPAADPATGATMVHCLAPLAKSKDVDALFASIAAERDQALYFVFDPLTIQAQKWITELAIEHKIPTVLEIRDYVLSGGLLPYTYRGELNLPVGEWRWCPPNARARCSSPCAGRRCANAKRAGHPRRRGQQDHSGTLRLRAVKGSRRTRQGLLQAPM
jgi:hypothetical protein